MPCAIVLFVDRPFEEADRNIGLVMSAKIRQVSAAPTRDIEVLVIRGFEHIAEAERRRLKKLRYNLVDASGVLASVKARYPYANETRVWRGEPFHEACFLRWLVLEEYFGSEPVLAMDGDIVWRVDPYTFLDAWTSGGSTLCFGAPCFAFIRERSWYEAYRSGLERLARDPGFGGDFAKDHFKGLYHDQALLQHLLRIGDLTDDTANLTGHGFSDRYFMTVNPLGIHPPEGEAPLTFEQTRTEDRIGGKVVPYWHMQTRFARYLWAVRAFPLLTGRRDLRVPYEAGGVEAPNPAVLMLANLHSYLQRGGITLEHPKLRVLTELAGRSGVYSQFFNGDLARLAFSDAVWWRPGVWAQ
jgi:hypothetical protein